MRWGVAGPGGIATRFAEAMRLVDDGEIVAVASRSRERADAYGDRFGVPRRYADYDELAADDNVDAVYVATPHARHEADTLRYVAADKHVLCEKPFALNAHQVERMSAAARRHGVFLMEALWSRFLPAYRILADLLAEEKIGQPLLVEADFGFRMPVAAEHRLFDPALGGGALLDLGIYPLNLCQFVLGNPDRITADAALGTTGVDEQVAAVLGYPGGALGVAKAAVRVPMACTGRIAGTDGWIDIPAFMHCPDHLVVNVAGKIERIEAPWEGDGLQFQVLEMQRCVAEGRTESSIMPLDDSLGLATMMDAIRRQIGLVYPHE
jgi:predicted dehydrogenase